MLSKKQTKWGWVSTVYTEEGPGRELGMSKNARYYCDMKVVAADLTVVDRRMEGLQWTGLSARLNNGGGSIVVMWDGKMLWYMRPAYLTKEGTEKW